MTSINMRASGSSIPEELPPDLARTGWFGENAGWFGTFNLWAARILITVALFGLWQGLTSFDLVDPFWISSPSDVFGRLAEDIQTERLWTAIVTTVREFVIGLALGSAVGISLGLVLGYLNTVYHVLEPILMGLYTLPRVALAPLFILWFGIGETSKIGLVFSIVVFLMLLNTYQGVRSVDPDIIDSVKTMGASKVFLAKRVILPSSVPWILSGLRLSAIYGIGGAVVGEMLLAETGLGVLLVTSSNNFDTTGVFEILLILGILGFAINLMITFVERLLLRWRRPA
jgi:NitT/TauT family transport system permease protein